MKIELDLNVIEKNARIREDQNFRFRSFLKGQDSKRVDELVHRLYEEVTGKIDCTECANCCLALETFFTKKEIGVVTDLLGWDSNDFIKTKTKPDEEEKNRFVLKSVPCLFLENRKCSVYPHRPVECREFPYLHKKDFTSRLLGVIGNYAICPIVYNVYENLKQEFMFR